MADDELSPNLKETILQSLRDERSSLAEFASKVQNKDVVIFIGNTRSGKSTLMNFIIGTELEAFKMCNKLYKIRKMKENVGPQIGQGSLSCTAVPTIDETNDLTYVDAPGFDDNRGLIQDIINALYINKIAKSRTVKFIMVSDINDLFSDNINSFLKFVQKFHTILPNYNHSDNSVSIVFTKDWTESSQEDISMCLQNKILETHGLECNRELIQSFVNNRKLIGVFRMPTAAGVVGNEINHGIDAAITNSSALNITESEVCFAISDEAMRVLVEICMEYTDSRFFDDELGKVSKEYQNYINIDQYVFASFEEELVETNENLEIINTNLNNEKVRNYVSMQDIQNSLNTLLQNDISREFIDNLQCTIELDDSKLLQDNYKAQIITKYRESLDLKQLECEKLIEKIDEEQSNRRTHKIVFSIAAGVGLVGGIPTLIGASQALQGVLQGTRIAAVTGPGAAAFAACEGILGTAAVGGGCAVGAVLLGGAAGIAYVLYKQTIGKRMQLRIEQGRGTPVIVAAPNE